MTKLSISCAATALLITFAPAANAYSTEPGLQSAATLTNVAMSIPQTAEVEGACTVDITLMLTTVLGLSDDWRGEDARPQQTSFACAQE